MLQQDSVGYLVTAVGAKINLNVLMPQAVATTWKQAVPNTSSSGADA